MWTLNSHDDGADVGGFFPVPSLRPATWLFGERKIHFTVGLGKMFFKSMKFVSGHTALAKQSELGASVTVEKLEGGEGARFAGGEVGRGLAGCVFKRKTHSATLFIRLHPTLSHPHPPPTDVALFTTHLCRGGGGVWQRNGSQGRMWHFQLLSWSGTLWPTSVGNGATFCTLEECKLAMPELTAP